jgi:hypothetical protein
MSQQDIEIAVRQRTAPHELRVAEETMTSPYLDHVRSTRNTIEALIVTREVELAKTSAAVQRQRIEADLTFLRDELARLDGEAKPSTSQCEACIGG